MSDEPERPTPDRRSRQFSLMALLALITLAAVLFAVPGGLAVVWSVTSPMITAAVILAALVTAQFPLYLLLRSLRQRLGNEDRRSDDLPPRSPDD